MHGSNNQSHLWLFRMLLINQSHLSSMAEIFLARGRGDKWAGWVINGLGVQLPIYLFMTNLYIN